MCGEGKVWVGNFSERNTKEEVTSVSETQRQKKKIKEHKKLHPMCTHATCSVNTFLSSVNLPTAPLQTGEDIRREPYS